jgi:ribosome-associated protein
MGGNTSDLLQVAVSAAENRRASDIVVLDLRGLSMVTDYFILCSGSSDTNVKAIADSIEEKLKEEGQRPFGIEGHQEGSWVLMDYIDFVLHIFQVEKRMTFALEDLWKDAKRVNLSLAPQQTGQGP